MASPRIIPSLLLNNGGLVKTLGFGKGKYIGDAQNAVRIFNEKQVDELCIFDIGATNEGRGPNFEKIATIADQCRMPLTYGGGVASADHAEILIRLGVEKVCISFAALENPGLISEIANRVGTQSVVVVLDIKKLRFPRRGYGVFTHSGSRRSEHDAIEFAVQAQKLGAGEIVINSIDNDGMMQGYDFTIPKMVREACTIPMTILGGAGSLEDLDEAIHKLGNVGAAAGSLFVFKGKYKAVLINYSRPLSALSHLK